MRQKKVYYLWVEYLQCKLSFFFFLAIVNTWIRFLAGQGAKEWAQARGHVIVEEEDLIDRKRQLI